MDAERLENISVAGLKRVFRSRLLGALALVTGVVSIGLVFGYASDSMYGVSHGINLIAYWHIAVAWVAAVALTVTFLGSILYLVTDTKYWSYLAHASGEAGFLFVTLTLVTGSIWARVIWNTWWEWSDIRLVTFLIVWFIYAGYLIIYSAGVGERTERFASVYAIIGFVTIPISYASTRLWTARFHAPSMGNPDADATITGSAVLVSLIALTVLYLYLVGSRVRLHEISERVDEVAEREGRETGTRREVR